MHKFVQESFFCHLFLCRPRGRPDEQPRRTTQFPRAFWRSLKYPEQRQMKQLDDNQILAKVQARERVIRSCYQQHADRRCRSSYDSDDLVASIVRRVLVLNQQGRLYFSSEAEFTSLVQLMSQRVAIDRNRTLHALDQFDEEDTEFVRRVKSQLAGTGQASDVTDLILSMLAWLKDPEDQQLVSYRLNGLTLRAAAQRIGIPSKEAAKKRWQRIKEQLCDRFAAQRLD